MNAVAFRKTLLAIAVAGAALPICAQTLILDNAGLVKENTSFQDTVEVRGSFTSANSDVDAIEFNSVIFKKDLLLEAAVNANGDNADGVDLSMSGDDEDWASMGPATEIYGDLLNKGTIQVAGAGASGILVDPAIVHGSLINEGTVHVSGDVLEGDGIRALEISGQSEIHKDVVNNGEITAEGENATAIQLMGSEIDGRLINNGLIQVTGTGADAIDVTTNEQSEWNWSKRASITAIENHGSILATGTDADGIQIDGGIIDSIENTGTIQADSTAIVIGGFEVSEARKQEQEYT